MGPPPLGEVASEGRRVGDTNFNCVCALKVWLLVGQKYVPARLVQITNNAGGEALLPAPEFLLQDSHRILPHTHLCPIQEKFVEPTGTSITTRLAVSCNS